jgi:bis(5'-nucleosyl)-tetraphosphatase (symmetrical)
VAIYVLGDVHGCFATLQALWKSLPFDPEHDELWLTGDLVNRGPDSLSVLRWARRRQRELGNRFRCVLGNHDLHLLAVAHGVAELRSKDTFDKTLRHRKAPGLLQWLQDQPVLHQHESGPTLVHAGLHPAWSAVEAARRARRVEDVLASPQAPRLLARWSRAADRDFATDANESPPHAEGGKAKLKAPIAAAAPDLTVFSRIRTCTVVGRISNYSGPPKDAPRGYKPWFEMWRRDPQRPAPVFFGHWAALGLYLGKYVVCVDTGCVWGRRLTAVRWPDLRAFQQARID